MLPLSFHAIDVPPAAIHQVVMIGQDRADHLAGHDLLLDREDVVDLFHLCFGDDGPEGSPLNGSDPMSFMTGPMALNFSTIWRTLPGLQCTISPITNMTQSLQIGVRPWESTSFAARILSRFSCDMKSGSGMAPVIADRNALVAS